MPSVYVLNITAYPPRPEDAEHIESQMRAAHWYNNDLRRLERHRRIAVRVAQRLVCPELDSLIQQEAALIAQLTELGTAIKDRRRQDRKGTAASKEERERKKEILAALALTRVKAKEERATLKNSRKMKAYYRLIDRYNHRARLDARANTTAYWGTYLQVEAAVKIAAKAVGDGPQFVTWDGRGKIAVQIQNGFSFDHALSGEDTRVRIEMLDHDAWLAWQGRVRHGPPRTPGSRRDSGPRAVRYGIFWMRAGSIGRSPRWVRLPIMIQRPWPTDGKIMWAWAIRRPAPTGKDGFQWAVQLVVRTDTSPAQHQRTGRCAINFGWRKMESGLRVAYWVGDDGKKGEVIVPNKLLARLDQAIEYRAARDNQFNLMRDKLTAWLASHGDLPPFLQEAQRTISLWRSKNRLQHLLDDWQKARQPDDDTIVADFEQWSRKEQQLHCREFIEREKAMLAKDDLFCCVAKDLATRYATILMEDHDFRDSASYLPTEEGSKGQGRELRDQQRRAAPSRLRERTKITCVREGTTVQVRSDKFNTQECHNCGHLEKWDAVASVYHTCSNCGERWDQDENNCLNQLKRNDERTDG